MNVDEADDDSSVKLDEPTDDKEGIRSDGSPVLGIGNVVYDCGDGEIERRAENTSTEVLVLSLILHWDPKELTEEAIGMPERCASGGQNAATGLDGAGTPVENISTDDFALTLRFKSNPFLPPSTPASPASTSIPNPPTRPPCVAFFRSLPNTTPPAPSSSRRNGASCPKYEFCSRNAAVRSRRSLSEACKESQVALHAGQKESTNSSSWVVLWAEGGAEEKKLKTEIWEEAREREQGIWESVACRQRRCVVRVLRHMVPWFAITVAGVLTLTLSSALKSGKCIDIGCDNLVDRVRCCET